MIQRLNDPSGVLANQQATLDFLPVKGENGWRETALRRAAERHGKPFKCGPDWLPHEAPLKKGERIRA